MSRGSRKQRAKAKQRNSPAKTQDARPLEVELVQSGGQVLSVEETMVALHQSSSGPIPSADELEKYEKLLPGAADRIMTQWEGETHHRRDFENRQLDASIRLAEQDRTIWGRGQIFALIIGLAAIASAVYLGAIGKEIAAGVIATMGIGTIGAAFIWGSRPDGQQQPTPQDDDES